MWLQLYDHQPTVALPTAVHTPPHAGPVQLARRTFFCSDFLLLLALVLFFGGGAQILEVICGPQGLSNPDVTLRTRSCYFLTKLVKAMKDGVVPYIDAIVPGVQGE